MLVLMIMPLTRLRSEISFVFPHCLQSLITFAETADSMKESSKSALSAFLCHRTTPVLRRNKVLSLLLVLWVHGDMLVLVRNPGNNSLSYK